MYPSTTETATEDHEFTDGSGDDIIPSTDLNAQWYNTIQRELLNILAGAGVTPDPADFQQIWGILQKIGLRVVVSTDATVDVSTFTGSTVVIHSASNFAISGTLQPKSFVVIIPEWVDGSGDSISVTYGGVALEISKYNIFFGLAMNSSPSPLYGVQVPIKKNDNSLSLVDLNVTNELKINKVIESNFVQFTYDENDESSWKSWQLASNWKQGQVKKVHATNEDGATIFVEGVGSVNFTRKNYREFRCVGFVTEGNIQYATFLVNG